MARRRDVRLITMESGNESESTDESDTEEEQENNQGNWDRVWPGTREKARERSIGHAILKTEPEDNIRAKNVITKAKYKDGTEQGGGAVLDNKVKGKGAGLDEEVQGMGAV